MAGAWTTKTVLDGTGAAFSIRVWDVDGAGGSGFEFGHAFDPAAQSNYETVAASQAAQVMGGAGATGDYIAGVLVTPLSTSPGNVILLDGSTSITIFAGGASSVSNLVPFYIPLGMRSVSGPWKITTGASVQAIGIGQFT